MQCLRREWRRSGLLAGDRLALGSRLIHEFSGAVTDDSVLLQASYNRLS